jgi:hypothetical protein
LLGSPAFAAGDPAITAGCAQLAQVGDFGSLKHAVALDVIEIHRLIREHSAADVESRVASLSEQIRRNTRMMAQMVDDRFTKVMYQQDLEFRTGLRDFSEGPTLDPIRKIERARLTELYNFSGEAAEPLTQVKLEYDSSHLSVHITRPSSLLEICQLPPSLMISIALKVQTLFSIHDLTYNIFSAEKL